MIIFVRLSTLENIEKHGDKNVNGLGHFRSLQAVTSECWLHVKQQYGLVMKTFSTMGVKHVVFFHVLHNDYNSIKISKDDSSEKIYFIVFFFC